MPESDDWDFNYSAKIISHIDGVLSYDTGDGTAPVVGQMVIGGTSGAIGKVLAKTGDAVSGTLTLTNVIGRWADDERLYIMSELMFDAVTVGNGGFKVGDTIKGATSLSTIVVKFIEYNIDGVIGHGKIYGTPMSAAFTDDEQLNIDGGQADVADADGAGTDNDALNTTTLVNGTLAVPGTANTNNSVIIHYDSGTIAIPEDAHIKSAISGAEGYAQKVIGSTTIGSIRIVDSDTTGGAWTNNETLRILDCVYYDNLVAGKVFSVGDIIKAVGGASPDAEGRVLAVIDDGDNTGKLILAGMSGTWDNDNEIHVKQSDDTYIKYAEVEDAQNAYLDAATINIPNGVRDEQREDQGGIYATGSLNIVRSANAFYSYAQSLYQELAQLDDLPALAYDVKDQLYTVLNDYIIPELSFRFIEKGAFTDTGKNNIFINLQSGGTVADIGDHGYFYDSSNPTPQPDMYLEQDGVVKRQDWLEGHVDILVKVKTKTDPAYINPTVAALGQLIDGGKLILHVRPYRRTYDSAEIIKPLGGQQSIFVSNGVDFSNTTGQYQAAFTGGSGTPFTVGEEITTAAGKRGIITSSDSGATGNITFVLKSSTNLADTDAISGSVSAATATINGAPTNLVAGYGTNIRVMTIDRRFTGGTTTGTFIIGEQVTQTGTGATGFILEDDSGTIYMQDDTGTFNGTGQLTGDTSSATNTPTATEDYTTAPKNIGGGVGDKNYTAVSALNITGASVQTVQKMYEWWKFLLRKESTLIQGGPGSAEGKEGRIYRRLVDTYAEVRNASPYGSKAGALVQGAQGMFIQDMASADLQNIALKDNLGDAYSPPNLQTMEMVNVFSGVRGAIFRTASEGSKEIQRTEFKVGTVGSGNNQAADSTILVAAQDRSVSPLPYDVPDSAVLYILDPNDTGNYLEFPYASVNRTTNIFTLTSGTIGNVTGGVDLTLNDNTHVVFAREQATSTSIQKTIQYVADIYLYGVARIKGKQPAETIGIFGSTGGSLGMSLQPDNAVNLP